MYKDQSIQKFCDDLSSKNVQMGGGSNIALNCATTNSLIQYICNLTIGKEKYINVEDDVKNILIESKNIQKYMLDSIDRDSNILQDILVAWKNRKNDENKYIGVCKEAVDFGIEILDKSFETLKLVEKISKIGNTNLASDFEIACFYAYSSVEASITNIKINLKSINDEKYKVDKEEKCKAILKESDLIKAEIIKITFKLI